MDAGKSQVPAQVKCLGDACTHKADSQQYQAIINAAQGIAWDLLRFDLSKRQYVMVAAIWLESLCKGRRSLVIPTWDVMGDLTGIRPTHISTTKDELVEMRVLEWRKVEGLGLEVRLQLDTNMWHCRPRQTRAKVKETREWLSGFNFPHLETEDGWKRSSSDVDWDYTESPRNFKPDQHGAFLGQELPNMVCDSKAGNWITEVVNH
jgi:hypothetical protein